MPNTKINKELMDEVIAKAIICRAIEMRRGCNPYSKKFYDVEFLIAFLDNLSDIYEYGRLS